jgi:hypothetical protein
VSGHVERKEERGNLLVRVSFRLYPFLFALSSFLYGERPAMDVCVAHSIVPHKPERFEDEPLAFISS